MSKAKIKAGVKRVRDEQNLTDDVLREKKKTPATTIKAINEVEKNGDCPVSEWVDIAAALDYSPGGLLNKVLR